MGLFDHLFKSKSPPSEEPSVEAGGNPQEPVKPADAAAGSTPSHRADPSVFLHPKSFVPRGATPLTPPGKSGAVSGVRKLGAPPAPPAPDEIVLVLGDVLSRIPTPYLKSGQHDPKRELRFSINDLSSDIARGRAAVPLSRIAQLMPDIFVRAISPDEDTEVRLPLQKLVEQIGLLRSRPPVGSGERVARPLSAPPLVETIHPQPDPEIRLEPVPTAAQTLEPARETLHDLLALAEPVIELKPVADAAAPVSVEPEPAPVDAPRNEETAPTVATAPEVPAPDPVDANAPGVVTPEEAPTAAPAPDTLNIDAFLPAPEAAEETAPPPPLPESSAPAPAPVVKDSPESEKTSESPAAEKPDSTPSEPVLPKSEAAVPAIPLEQTVPEVMEDESGDERIHLSLAAILRECPPEIIVGDVPEVPDNVRITLPFAPIDRQLVMGHVEISSARFVAALPFSYQKYFTPAAGIKVSIPLEEVFQNLPDPAAAARAAAQPPMQILAPAEGGTIAVPSEEKVHSGPHPEKSGGTLDREEPKVVDQPQETASLDPAAPEPRPSEPNPPAVPALDLPAFHLYVPPPPVILPEEVEPPTVVSIAPEQPTENTSPFTPTASLTERDAPKSEALSGELPGVDIRAAVSGDAPADALPLAQPTESLNPDADAPTASNPDTQVDVTDGPAMEPAGNEQVETEPVEKEQPVAEPPFQGNSAAVFAEANQTIPAPLWARPFIVLPPPIFGYTPPPAPEDIVVNKPDINGAEAIASKFTEEDDLLEMMPTEMESSPLDLETKPAEDLIAALPPENFPTEKTAPEEQISGGPTIISIDFSEALVPSDESALTNAAPLLEISEVPPHEPVDPPAEAGPETDEPEAAIAETAAPEAVSIPAVELGASVRPSEEPAPDAGPVAAQLPVEAPANTIVFTVEGQFTERPSQAMPDWEPAAEQESPSAESRPVGTEPSSDEPPGAAPAPLLSLPRFIADPSSADVLPPPAFPLRRFDQDALQTLFMTDEVLDLRRISRLAAQLPGVHACVIATRDQACTGGRLPEGFDLAALLGLAPRVGEAAGRMPIGELKHFTLYGDQYSVSFFERNGLSLCAVHRPRSFVPGVREKLVAIADELSK